MPFQLIKELFVDLPESFYTNIAYQFFDNKITFVSFTQPKTYFVPKTGFKR